MTLRELFEQFSGAVAYVSVENDLADIGIGTAFHVGEGIFVTARHVIEGKTIREVASTTGATMLVKDDDGNVTSKTEVGPRAFSIVEGPHFASDPAVDVAVFRVGNIDPRLPRVPLGSHLDDTIGDNDFVLSDVVIIGYPPVPGTNSPRQITARGEVNAVVDLRHSPNVHFIVSSLARGGFSGGLVLSEFGYALGMVTESLGKNNEPAELGFMSVLGVEALHKCINEHFKLDQIDWLLEVSSWDFIKIRLSKESVVHLNPRLSEASIRVYDDDRDVFGEITCGDVGTLSHAFSAFNSKCNIEIVDQFSRPGYMLFTMKENPSKECLEGAAQAAKLAFIENGYCVCP
jgi:hypothetical protein